jgi:hypothetical protein
MVGWALIQGIECNLRIRIGIKVALIPSVIRSPDRNASTKSENMTLVRMTDTEATWAKSYSNFSRDELCFGFFTLVVTPNFLEARIPVIPSRDHLDFGWVFMEVWVLSKFCSCSWD